MSHVSLIIAFFMGITGSLHCVGMCGPIVWIMPFQMLSSYRKWAGILLYHLGRISVYALLGLLLYSFKSMFSPHWQQYISIVLGAGLLIAGGLSFVSNGRLQIKLPFSGDIKLYFGRFITNPSLSSLLASGMLNGLLPCGMVYIALSISVTAATPPMSMLLMYAFGIGTMPILVALTILKGRISLAKNVQLKKMVPIIMFFFGCVFMLRGMNLGIPYLSPKVEIENHILKASCCHKTQKN